LKERTNILITLKTTFTEGYKVVDARDCRSALA
jgi:hypothetical protein